MSNKSISYKSLKVRQETDYPVSPFLALLRIRPKVFSYKGFVSRQTLRRRSKCSATKEPIVLRFLGKAFAHCRICTFCSGVHLGGRPCLDLSYKPARCRD